MKETLVFATNNAHKLQEAREILGERFVVKGLAEIGCHDEIPETADTIEGNAEQKARYVKEHYGYDCFSDDSGFFVDALGGAPGVHSARYAGDNHDSEANIDRVLGELLHEERRTACFRTAVALLRGERLQIFEGRVGGTVLRERRGTGGFGYDSIFCPEGGGGLTFAQMSADAKNAISHRGRALNAMARYLLEERKSD